MHWSTEQFLGDEHHVDLGEMRSLVGFDKRHFPDVTRGNGLRNSTGRDTGGLRLVNILDDVLKLLLDEIV